MSEKLEALQRLIAAIKTYTEDRETSVPDEPVIPEPINQGHPIHNAVVEVQKHYGGKLPVEGGAWEAWRWLLWYSRAKGNEGPFEQANKAYHYADELHTWAEAKLRELTEQFQADGQLWPSSVKWSPRELADKHGVDAGALRKRLDCWRYAHDAGYIEVTNPARNQPKYLYNESAVMSVIESLKSRLAGRKRAANVQQKKV